MNQTDFATARPPAPADPQFAARPSFADEVRGQDPKGIDLTMAKLMRDVYDYDRNGRQDGVPPWRAMSNDELKQVGIDPNLLTNRASGFKAAMYTDGNGRHVLAFSGTDEPKDWVTNFGQGLGFDTAQYNQAVALAKQAKVAFGQEVAITGHSLGGGLAATAAIAADIPAVTFNAAGVNDKTLTRLGLDPAAVKREAENGGIRRYAVDNEILTELQENKRLIRRAMPDAVGHKIELQDPDPLGRWERLNPIKNTRHAVNLHYIDAVINAMEKTYGKDFDTRAAMSNPQHPAHAGFDNALTHTRAAVAPDSFLLGSEGQRQAFAGALVRGALERGVDPNRLGGVLIDEPRNQTYAMLGRGEGQSVGFQLNTAEAANASFAENSRVSRELLQPQAQTVAAVVPQTQTAVAVAPQPEAPAPVPDPSVAGRGR